MFALCHILKVMNIFWDVKNQNRFWSGPKSLCVVLQYYLTLTLYMHSFWPNFTENKYQFDCCYGKLCNSNYVLILSLTFISIKPFFLRKSYQYIFIQNTWNANVHVLIISIKYEWSFSSVNTHFNSFLFFLINLNNISMPCI